LIAYALVVLSINGVCVYWYIVELGTKVVKVKNNIALKQAEEVRDELNLFVGLIWTYSHVIGFSGYVSLLFFLLFILWDGS
jgi:hypothetical protein